MLLGHCCMYFCFVTFGVHIDIEKKSHETFTMTTVGSCFGMLNKTTDNHFTKINCFDLAFLQHFDNN